ncbi:MAG: WD40/YVTN/BNR-like repeat-containing protein [Pyrinomonadaceae bacterium]
MFKRTIASVRRPRFSQVVFSLLLVAACVFSGTASIPAYDGPNVFIDPMSATQWSILGPNGGDVRSVEIDPRDKDKLYIGTTDGQIHISEDAGKTWRLLVRFDIPLFSLDQLLVDRRDSSVIYASGHRGKLPGGFFKSTDGGKTWKESKELKNEAIHAMTQSEKDPNQIFVGTKSGIFVSNDSGDDWTKIQSESMPQDVNSMAIDPRNTSTIYAGTTWRPYKSTDSGKSWRLIKNGMIDDSDVFAITINSTDNDHLIASACSGIYESMNGGENWRKIQGIPSTSRRTRDIVQHPTHPGTVYAATTQGFWMSTNGGRSWSMTTARTLEVNSIAVHPAEPNRVFIGTNNFGVMVSTDGGRNFVATNDSFTSRFTYSVTPDLTVAGRLYATTKNTSTGGGFFFWSSDGGANWTQAKGLDINRNAPFAVLQDRADPNKMYLGTNAGLFESLDRGVSWKPVTGPKPVKKARSSRSRSRRGKTAAKVKASPGTVIDPATGQELVPVLNEKIHVLVRTEDDKNGILAGTNSGLYRSYDLSKGWEKITFGEGLDHSVYAITVSPLVPGTIWVGTTTSGVLTSRDNGETWTKIGGAPDNVPISSIVIDPKRPNYIYVGSIHSLYRSQDGGRTWLPRGSNLPLGNFTSILIDPRNSDEVLVSSALENDGGVYYSKDAGKNWRRVDSKEIKLPSRRVWMMAFDPNNADRIYAGSHSSGVYVINRNVERAASVDTASTVSSNK